jgi:hypothetical protein
MKENTTPIDFTWMSKTGGFAKDMTLRDHYAGLAMKAIRGNLKQEYWGEEYSVKEMMQFNAEYAYEQADAMLKARAK